MEPLTGSSPIRVLCWPAESSSVRVLHWPHWIQLGLHGPRTRACHWHTGPLRGLAVDWARCRREGKGLRTLHILRSCWLVVSAGWVSREDSSGRSDDFGSPFAARMTIATIFGADPASSPRLSHQQTITCRPTGHYSGPLSAGHTQQGSPTRTAAGTGNSSFSVRSLVSQRLSHAHDCFSRRLIQR